MSVGTLFTLERREITELSLFPMYRNKLGHLKGQLLTPDSLPDKHTSF